MFEVIMYLLCVVFLFILAYFMFKQEKMREAQRRSLEKEFLSSLSGIRIHLRNISLHLECMNCNTCTLSQSVCDVVDRLALLDKGHIFPTKGDLNNNSAEE